VEGFLSPLVEKRCGELRRSFGAVYGFLLANSVFASGCWRYGIAGAQDWRSCSVGGQKVWRFLLVFVMAKTLARRRRNFGEREKRHERYAGETPA
jgi:hypothetical protein